MSNAQTWASIAAIIAILLSFVTYVGMEVRDLRKDGKDNTLRLERHDFQFEKLNDRFDAMDQQFAGLRTTGEQMAEQIYGISKKLDDHLRRHAS